MDPSPPESRVEPPGPGRSRERIAVVVAVVLAVLWGLAAGVVGPVVLRASYEGDGPTVLNHFFAAKAASGRPLEYYLEKLSKLHLGGQAAILLVGAATLLLWRDERRGSPVARRVVGEATPRALGAIRMAVCLIAALMVGLETLPNAAAMPAGLELHVGQGVYGLFRAMPGSEDLVRSERPLEVLQSGTLVLLLMAAAGLATRATLPLATIGYVLIGGVLRSYSHFFHTGALPMFLLAILAVSPCADGWSLDRRLRSARGRPVAPEVPSLRYGWYRFAIWAAVAISYFAAGTSKIRHGGWMWWEGVNLKTILLADALNPMPTAWPVGLMLRDAPDWAFAGLGLGTLVIEIGYILVPFSRWARRVFPALAVGLHLGILLTQNILFIDLILLQMIFYDYSWLLRAIGVRRPARAPVETAPTPGPGAGPLVAAAVCVLMTLSAAFDVEFYPLTTWGMYATRTESTEIHYYRFVEVAESGERRPARLHHAMPLVRDARYFDVVGLAFRDASRHPALREFLDACGRRRNRALPPGDRVVAYHIERWSWDHRRPDDPPLPGRLVDRFEHRLNAPRPTGRPARRDRFLGGA